MSTPAISLKYGDLDLGQTMTFACGLGEPQLMHQPRTHQPWQWVRIEMLQARFAAEISPQAWQEVRKYIAAVSEKERTEALAEGRRYADQVRRELGLPTRFAESVERFRGSAQRLREQAQKLAVALAPMKRLADEPTPIYDALVAERGAEA